MTQEETWLKHYNEYRSFLKENCKRPSKHYLEDRALFNWYKHNKKIYLSGRMPFDRLTLFRLLLEDAERMQKINQYAYVHAEDVDLLSAAKQKSAVKSSRTTTKKS